MIILLSADLHQAGKSIARQYNEKLYKYERIHSEPIFANETRISFDGHSDTRTFGDAALEPHEFAKYLVDNGLSKNKKVVLDLLGCESGYTGPGKDQASYAHQVYEELQKLGYINITVNSFTNVLSYETLTCQRVKVDYSLTLVGNREVETYSLVGFNYDDEQKFENDPEVKRLKIKRQSLVRSINDTQIEIVEKYEMLKRNIEAIIKSGENDTFFEPKISIPHLKFKFNFSASDFKQDNTGYVTEQEIYSYISEQNRLIKEKGVNSPEGSINASNIIRFCMGLSSSCSNEISELTQLSLYYKELNQVYSYLETIRQKYFKTVFRTTDFREAFDVDASFNVNAATYNDWKLTDHAKMAITRLNRRIAELKIEYNEAKDNILLSFISDTKTKIKKIIALENLVKDIRCHDNIYETKRIIEKACQNTDLATARTKVTLNEIRNDLNMMSSPENNPAPRR